MNSITNCSMLNCKLQLYRNYDEEKEEGKKRIDYFDCVVVLKLLQIEHTKARMKKKIVHNLFGSFVNTM